jgi:hypothetical protein
MAKLTKIAIVDDRFGVEIGRADGTSVKLTLAEIRVASGLVREAMLKTMPAEPPHHAPTYDDIKDLLEEGEEARTITVDWVIEQLVGNGLLKLAPRTKKQASSAEMPKVVGLTAPMVTTTEELYATNVYAEGSIVAVGSLGERGELHGKLYQLRAGTWAPFQRSEKG